MSETRVMTNPSAAPHLNFVKPQAIALGAAVVGLVLCAVGMVTNPGQFYHSYLVGYLFWFGIALGCLPLLLINQMTGGAWGLVIRRPLEAATRTLPLLLVLFIPVILGMHYLYEWTHPDLVAADSVLRHKAAWLNKPFWIARVFVYFAIWIGIAYRLSSWSAEQDRTGDVNLTRKMQVLAGPGIVFYFLAITFAAVDWVMSLDPHWLSSIFGPLIAAGQVLNAFAFMILLLAILAPYQPFAGILRPGVFHDQGKLLLAFVMIWTYFSFSQLLIIWAGNLPEEIHWYLEHSKGTWMTLGIFIILFHFFVPFFLLLSRDLKRNPRTLAAVASWLIFMRFVEIFWTVTPLFHPENVTLSYLDVACTVGIGGIWMWVFLHELKSRPMIPLHDPYLEISLEKVGH
jgi:hypothetical protein